MGTDINKGGGKCKHFNVCPADFCNLCPGGAFALRDKQLYSRGHERANGQYPPARIKPHGQPARKYGDVKDNNGLWAGKFDCARLYPVFLLNMPCNGFNLFLPYNRHNKQRQGKGRRKGHSSNPCCFLYPILRGKGCSSFLLRRNAGLVLPYPPFFSCEEKKSVSFPKEKKRAVAM